MVAWDGERIGATATEREAQATMSLEGAGGDGFVAALAMTKASRSPTQLFTLFLSQRIKLPMTGNFSYISSAASQ